MEEILRAILDKFYTWDYNEDGPKYLYDHEIDDIVKEFMEKVGNVHNS